MRLNLNGHFQTIWGHLSHSPTLKSSRLESLATPWVIDLPDGDQLMTIIARHPDARPNHVIYAFHGLSGSSDSDYMRRLAIRVLSEPKLRHAAIVLVNQRGTIPSVKASRPYHAGLYQDFLEVMQQGQERFQPDSQLAIGYSLGGNTLLLGLGHSESKARFKKLVRAALAVNPPIDLESCSLALHQGLSRLYELRFLKLCYQKAKELEAAGGPRAPKLTTLRTLRDFDENYTSKQAGFLNRSDYYKNCSALPYLSQIEINTSIFTSDDDPFVLSSLFKRAVDHPQNLTMHVEQWGGHMGYLRKGVRHMDEWILKWILKNS